MADELEDVEHEAEKVEPGHHGKGHHIDKGKAALIVIGFVTLVIIFAQYRKSQSAAQSSALPQIPLTPMGSPSSNSTPDLAGLLSSLSAQIDASSQATIAAINAPPSGSTSSKTYTDLAGELFQGSGWYVQGQNTNIVTADGTWAPMRSTNAAKTYAAEGGKLYYQPSKGVFQAVTDFAKLAPGTVTFAKAS